MQFILRWNDIQLNQYNHSHCAKGLDTQIGIGLLSFYKLKGQIPHYGRQAGYNVWWLLSSHLKSIMGSVVGLSMRNTEFTLGNTKGNRNMWIIIRNI